MGDDSATSTTRRGRTVKVVDYSEGLRVDVDGSIDIEASTTIEERLELLHRTCCALGFDSIFDAATLEAKFPSEKHKTKQKMREFAQGGGFASMYYELNKSNSFNQRGRPSKDVCPIPPGISTDDVCAM